MKFRVAFSSDWSGKIRPRIQGVYSDGPSQTGGDVWVVDIMSESHLYDVIANADEDPCIHGVVMVTTNSVFPDDPETTMVSIIFMDDTEEFCWMC